MKTVEPRYGPGDIVRHRFYNFRGVVFDVDAEFANTEEWYRSIPADRRPRKDQPYYHLFAVNPHTHYIAYVSEQNLVHDHENGPVPHPAIDGLFRQGADGRYVLRVHSA